MSASAPYEDERCYGNDVRIRLEDIGGGGPPVGFSSFAGRHGDARTTIPPVDIDALEEAPFAPPGIGDTAPLARIQMFTGLSLTSLQLIASIASAQSYSKNTVLFRAGDPGDRLYVIMSGRVRISREVPGMGEEALAIFGPGDYFGEMAIIDEAPRSADAHVHEACTLLEIRKDAMEHLMFLHKDLAYEVLWNVVRTLSARLRDTTDKVTFLAVTGKFT